MTKPCFFGCGRLAVDNGHLIRRSWGKYQKLKKNIVPMCRECHDIFDNKPWMRHVLPNLERAKSIIKEIDEEYYNITFEL